MTSKTTILDSVSSRYVSSRYVYSRYVYSRYDTVVRATKSFWETRFDASVDESDADSEFPKSASVLCISAVWRSTFRACGGGNLSELVCVFFLLRSMKPPLLREFTFLPASEYTAAR